MSVKRPTLEQIAGYRRQFRDEHDDGADSRVSLADGGQLCRLRSGRPNARRNPGRQISAHARISAGAEETRSTPGTSKPTSGRVIRQAQGQDRRGEGQCLRRWRPDDERLLDARGLHPQHRRDHRHPVARRWRGHQGKIALRIVLSLRRQPYRARSVRCTIRTNAAIPPAVRPRAAAHWSRLARSISRLAATRAARSACPRRFVASTA